MPQIVTGEGNVGFPCEWDNLNRTTTSVYDHTIVNSSDGIMLTNKLSIVQVIDKNKLRWFGLVMRREEESMLRVVMQLNMDGNIPRGNTTWLDNIGRHQKEMNTSLKEVLRTKCFENRHDWRTSISRSTDRNYGEDHWAPPWSVANSEHHSPLLQIVIQGTMLRCKSAFYYDTYGSSAGILELTASSWFLDRGLHLCNRVSSTQKINSCLLHAY